MSQHITHESWAESGVPQGRVERLLYNLPANTLIVVVKRSLQRGLSTNRLYCRSATGAVALASLISAGNAPFLRPQAQNLVGGACQSEVPFLASGVASTCTRKG